MATRKAADSALYHLSPKGFWKKFRDITVVNPQISSGLPLPDKNRYPQPASRPEKYATPATKASDPAQNPYWKRDVRRAYPQLSVVTQDELTSFMLQSPPQPAVAASEIQQQTAAEPTEGASVPTTLAAELPLDLSVAIATVAKVRKIYAGSRSPPVLPTAHKRWEPEFVPDAPHDPHSYFPMKLVK